MDPKWNPCLVCLGFDLRVIITANMHVLSILVSTTGFRNHQPRNGLFMWPSTCFMSVLKGTHSIPSHSQKCFSYFGVFVTHPSIYNSELHNHIESGGEVSRASIAQVLGTQQKCSWAWDFSGSLASDWVVKDTGSANCLWALYKCIRVSSQPWVQKIHFV